MSHERRRLAAANSKWLIFFDHLDDGRGHEVHDYLVIESLHPRPDKITGICVLPIVNGQFLLIKFHRHALATTVWETPRGFIDVGETPAEAARRELTEETGLICAENDLIPLGIYAPEASTMAARGALFVARHCTGILRAAEDEIGLGELRLFKADEMARLVANGGVEDAGTLICYYRFRASMAGQEPASG
jgi:8-oxo-dGTP pyrophosphatase MutT (NUDIX family)